MIFAFNELVKKMPQKEFVNLIEQKYDCSGMADGQVEDKQ